MASKGVIVDLDFTALNGAEMLFGLTRDFLAGLDGIPFDDAVEARYFAGQAYQAGFAAYFPVVRTKKTALKAGRDVALGFTRALNAAIPTVVSVAFRNFVRGLDERGVKVVLVTRATLTAVADAFSGLLGQRVALCHEESSVYGSMPWESWRQVCLAQALGGSSTVAVTGSGFGVKAALRAGLHVAAVVSPRTAYQDYTGMDVSLRDLNAAAARRLLGVLKV